MPGFATLNVSKPGIEITLSGAKFTAIKSADDIGKETIKPTRSYATPSEGARNVS